MVSMLVIVCALSACDVEPLVPTELASNDQFGKAVAIDGAIAVVGLNRNDTGFDEPGAAHVFRLADGLWGDEALLEPPDGTNLDLFGRAVAVSGDRIAVGAYGDDLAGAFAGSVYLFAFDGAAWVFDDLLTAPDASAGDRFGFDVAIEGERLVVGAPFDDDDGVSSGSAWVFERVDGVWTPLTKLTAPDAAPHDIFGTAVSINGRAIAIGAPLHDGNGSDAGGVFVFRDLAHEQSLTGAAAFDQFGIDVASSGDLIVVGAHLAGAASEGAASVLRFDGRNWIEETVLAAPVAEPFTQFGIAVDVEGPAIIVGAHGDDALGENAGAAHLFRLVSGAWRHVDELVAPDGVAQDRFGRAVGLGGGRAIVGAFRHDGCPDLFEILCGAAYIADAACAPADLDGDGIVGFSDLLILLADWGPCTECLADLDGDGVVGLADLLDLLAGWG